MAFANRCRFLAAAGGTGNFVVASNIAGYMTPAQAHAVDGESYSYAAEQRNGAGAIIAWEIGTGVYSAGVATLSRVPTFSSNANALVSFSAAPNVTLTPLAADLQSSVGFSPPASTTSAGTASQLELDVTTGDLWACIATNQWQVYKGGYTTYTGSPPRGVIVDVMTQPYRSLVSGGDWTAALNAASAYVLATDTKIGTIVLPPFNITITDTWNIGDTAGVGPGTGYSVTINVQGSAISQITYNGPLDGRPAIRVAKNKRFTFTNFSLIQNANTNPGTSIGLALGGSNNSDSSTQCTGGILEFVQLSGFQTNLTDFIGAASEMLFANCWFTRATPSAGLGYSTWGARFDQFNSTNHTYLQCQFGNNDIGLDVSSNSDVSVYNGGGSQNGIDFKLGLRCRLAIDGVRNDGFGSVTTGRFLVGNSGNVTLRNCRVNLANGGDNISISGIFTDFKIESSTINGYISFDNVVNAQSITMINNFVWVRGNGLPFTVASGVGSQAQGYVVCRNNNYTNGDVYDSSPNRIPVIDFDGRLSTDDFSDFFFDPVQLVQKIGTSDSFAGGYTDPIGVVWQALHRVKCLSEYRVPGQGSPFTTGQNLRVQGKFASSGSLSLTFQRTASVTYVTNSTVLLGSGTFFSADIGKQVFIAGAGNPSGDFNGCIDGFTAGNTECFVIPANARHLANFAGSKNMVIGANEPDANYMVIVTGNANETFWVDTITSTGFTVHSSNAASTATVTCLIIR